MTTTSSVKLPGSIESLALSAHGVGLFERHALATSFGLDRSYFISRDDPIALHKLYSSQIRLVKKFRTDPELNAGKALGSGKQDSEELMTWKSFSQNLPPEFRHNAAIRQEFSEFLARVKTWLIGDHSGEIEPGELHGAAKLIYDELSTVSLTLLSKATRAGLEKRFGKVTDQVFTSVHQQVLRLVSEKRNAERVSKLATSKHQSKKEADSKQAEKDEKKDSKEPASEKEAKHSEKERKKGAHLDPAYAPATVNYVGEYGDSQPFTDPTVYYLGASRGAVAVTPEQTPLYPIPRFRLEYFNVTQDDPAVARSREMKSGGGEAVTSAEPYTYKWLVAKCEPFVTYSASGTTDFDEFAMARATVDVLKSKKSSEQIQGELLDLLGFEAIELISELIANRAILAEVKIPTEAELQKEDQTKVKHFGKPTLTKEMKKKFAKLTEKMGANAAAAGMLRNPMVHTMDAAQYNLIHSLDHLKGDATASVLQAQAMQAEYTRLQQAAAQAQEQGDGSGDGLTVLQQLRQTPGMRPGYVQQQFKTHSEVFIPATERAPLVEEELIGIEAFDEIVRPALAGIKRLNLLQSKVFHCAYGSNENMLVCAPTGAGKTNVALMTVLREVMNHVEDNVINKHDFKIVYVAPMKALAQEVTEKFSKFLAPLKLIVKELTGDTQLTKREIMETQMIVTTPEKWDVVTRKAGDGSLIQMVRLLILDEVHLLHEDRGPVIEILVSRTMRNIETTQQLCRIVGLSATLPNYADVAEFLGVNPKTGLHVFDARYRPVPLEQTYIGVSERNTLARLMIMNEIAYRKCVDSLAKTNQVMIFVHARRDTIRMAQFLIENARATHEEHHLSCREVPGWDAAMVKFSRICKTREIVELVRSGVGVHHAGMSRAERTFIEQAFTQGHLAVIVCTATLAWGVNLPAHTVILRGTQIYEPKKGGWTDIGMLDVMQIFGRAGRPQFDSSGEAILITSSDKVGHYLNLLTAQLPIESQFIQALPDHLNAEIILGTVTNMREAEEWLTYTYLYVRMLRNPLIYGIPLEDMIVDPRLVARRRELLKNAARELVQCRMIKYDPESGNLYPTAVGRVASLYYIHHKSVETYNNLLRAHMPDEDILELIAHSREFSQLRTREEEESEIARLKDNFCPFTVKSPMDSYVSKANVLLQCYISNHNVESTTLGSDSYFIQQSASRIARALFEMVLRRGRAYLAAKLLDFCKMIERRQWYWQHPLRQFKQLKPALIHKLEQANLGLEELAEMTLDELHGVTMTGHPTCAQIKHCVAQIPWIQVIPSCQPLTRDVLRVQLKLIPQLRWNSQVHGNSEPFWIWIEDVDCETIYHHESWLLPKGQHNQEHVLVFTIPIQEPLPTQYVIRVISDRWIGAETVVPLSFQSLLLPDQHPPHTELLPLQPLPVTVLQDERAQRLYTRFTHFNPVQTQVFHTLYHTDTNALLGAPTGSGKTVVAEFALLRLMRAHPDKKAVYIAPMKALAKERMDDWNSNRSFKGIFGLKIVELTGDASPDAQTLRSAQLIITTPEKWDGVSRNWQTRDYVSKVGLVIIDEIHLLGQDRGPILEVIVSRMRFISSQMKSPIRIIGLSTALSNAKDLADWLAIPHQGLFNFPPSVRPVPTTIYVAGYPGKHYCPRMATMNKPTYAAITTHSPDKPVLVFVSSRRQTRLTGLDLITFAAGDGRPRRFLRMDDEELENVLIGVRDTTLKHLLSFGIGIHHAGLAPSDRTIVEELFLKLKIQVLVCTATLAWGINFPAHLVVVKGTEYYDAKRNKYVDFSVTDVLQMIGRAGRPQFDKEGKACVLVHEPKKDFYRKFLHSPFPVESSLHEQLHNHLNAEIASGAITSVLDAADWLSWTFFFRRLLINPSYYGLVDATPTGAQKFILALIEKTILELQDAGLVEYDPKTYTVAPTSIGTIAAFYYIDYRTAQIFCNNLHPQINTRELLECLCCAHEYAEMPVRHNEDKLNESMLPLLKWPIAPHLVGDPHAKTNILMQARFSKLPLPISDYLTDTKSALDQSARFLQSLVDLAADAGWLNATIQAILFVQMIVQGHWQWDSPFTNLPGITRPIVRVLKNHNIESLPQLMATDSTTLRRLLQQLYQQEGEAAIEPWAISEIVHIARSLPRIRFKVLTDDEKEKGGVPKLEVENGGDQIEVRFELCRENGWLRRDEKSRKGQDPVQVERAYMARHRGKEPPKLIGPKDVKTKREGWWILAGRTDYDALDAMKRVSVGVTPARPSLLITTPPTEGVHRYTAYLLSDCYMGLDQEIQFDLVVKNSAPYDDSTVHDLEGGQVE